MPLRLYLRFQFYFKWEEFDRSTCDLFCIFCTEIERVPR